MTESTYVCDDVDSHGQSSQEKARERGHMHLRDFIQNKDLFENVSDIILMHFSDKYSINYIREQAKLLPPCLINKVHLALIAAETTKFK
jgi:ribonuclease Z